MAMNLINDKPSVFLTPEMPTSITTDYETYFADHVSIATEMAEETLNSIELAYPTTPKPSRNSTLGTTQLYNTCLKPKPNWTRG